MKLFSSVTTTEISEVDTDNVNRLLNAMRTAEIPTSAHMSPVKWAKHLAQARAKYSDFHEVFSWVMKSYPKSEYLQNCFQSAKAIADNFRELRLEYEKARKSHYLIPETTMVDFTLLHNLYEKVEEQCPDWMAKEEYKRFMIYEYLDLCYEVEVALIEVIEGYKKQSQIWSDIVGPLILEILQQEYENMFISHINSLSGWTKWDHNTLASYQQMNLKNPLKLRVLLRQLAMKTRKGADNSETVALLLNLVFKKVIACR